MSDLKDVQAALERGSGIVLVGPPAPDQADVWELLAPGSVIVCSDQAAAIDWVAAAPSPRRVHAVTGLARTARLLRTGPVDVLAGALPDLATLVSQAALKLAGTPTVVLAWPETLRAGDHVRGLDELLAEAAGARRIVLSWDPSLLTEFLERHAHRAPVFGDLPVDADGRRAPVAAARYAIATPERRLAALRDLLDAINPASVFIWTPDERHATRLRETLGALPGSVVTDVPAASAELVVCARMPSRRTLARLVGVGPVAVLAAPYQLPYLRLVAAPLEAVPLPTAADGARDRAAVLRDRIAARLRGGDVDAELLTLAALFEHFDPAEVAAALLALRREETTEPATTGAAPAAAPPRVRIFVNVGRKHGAAAKDLVGAMTRELGIAKSNIGRVELRETFTLVEVPTQLAETVVQGLSRVAIRGRRVTARLDQAR